MPQYGFALPQGAQVVAGGADISTAGNTMNVNVSTDKMIANWQSFSIAHPETVNFIQPSSSSVALNRVVGVDPSSIMGALNANGKIFLINPNGILFGAGSSVNTAGLVASTLNISNQDFLAGRYKFYGPGGSVVNQGYISTPGGYVALLGSSVGNSGTIEASLGSIALASGNAITLNLDPKGLISVVVDKATTQNLENKADAVKNTGTISANGGKVILTAKALAGVFDKAINNEGIIEANTLNNQNGQVVLEANRRVNVAGTINAAGGTVTVNSQGADFSGDINSAEGIFNANGGDTNILGGSYIGDKSWSDNLNIFVSGKITVAGNLTITADADNNGSGDLWTFAGIKTNWGSISLSGSNVYLNSMLTSLGGDIDVTATNNVIHFALGDVKTNGDNFKGNAGNNYTLRNGASIDTTGSTNEDEGSGEGIIDVYAGNDIVLGNTGDPSSIYLWNYLSGNRGYKLTELGYYYNNGSNLVSFVKGADIGKDGTSPTFGAGFTNNTNPIGPDFKMYAKFKTYNSTILTWYEDSALNADKDVHVKVKTPGTVYKSNYKWDDQNGGGDRDFNDAVIGVSEYYDNASGGASLLSPTSIFLTADNGSITQVSGSISSKKLMLSANTGIAGTGLNNGIQTQVSTLSAENKLSGDISVDNTGPLTIANLNSVLSGLNSGVRGTNGVNNAAGSGNVYVTTHSPLSVNADISAGGDINLTAGNSSSPGDDLAVNANITSSNGGIYLTAGDNITQADGTIIQTNDGYISLGADNEADGSGGVTQEGTATIVSNGGDIDITAGTDEFTGGENILLTKVNAGTGNVFIGSGLGSILDNDTTDDVDIIANNLEMWANGTIGFPSSLPTGNYMISPFEGMLDTQVNSIDATSAQGGVYLNETDAVDLVNIQSGATPSIYIFSGGNMSVGTIYDPTDVWLTTMEIMDGIHSSSQTHLVTASDLHLWAKNMINQVYTDISNVWTYSDTSSISLYDKDYSGTKPSIHLKDIDAAQGISVYAGWYNLGPALDVYADNVKSRGNSQILLQNGLADKGDLYVDNIATGQLSGLVKILGYNSIIDNNGSANNISGYSLEADADNGIGSGNALETTLGRLYLDNSTSGNIEIDNTGGLFAEHAINNAGDVYITTHSDLTLGYIEAIGNFVGLNAVNGSILNGSGSSLNILAKTAKLDALSNIGLAGSPINTNVDVLAGFSSGTGDIYINEADNIELGGIDEAGKGYSLAANNGIIHVISAGDMTVNSVVAPRGGVFLESTNGSIYAGSGWSPEVSSANAYTMDLSGTEWQAIDGINYFSAVTSPSLILGSNVIAGGYSYFSAPAGTIGVGSPGISVNTGNWHNPLLANIQVVSGSRSAVPAGFNPTAGLTLNIGSSSVSEFTIDTGDGNGPLGVSGAIAGIVRPGTTAVTGVYPSPAIDHTSTSPLNPPGYVFYDDTDVSGASALFVPAVSNLSAPQQIWPQSSSSVNTGIGQLMSVFKSFRAYYEILNPSQFYSFEPVTPIEFAYHPLTPTDSSAFDGITLNIGAYRFIQNKINLKKPLAPYFGYEGKKKKKRVKAL